MPLIYIVDDEPHIRHLAAVGLKDAGFETAEFSDGAVLLHAVNQKQPDAILLDWMMPGQDGLSVLKTLRQNAATRPIPILMMTARSDEVDRVLGLELGADDYVTKPFRPRELVARIRAALRKSGRSGAVFKISGLSVDTASGVVKKNGGDVFLSALEYRLLLVFVNNPKMILTRGRLLDELWDAAGEYVNDNTLTVYIKRLREKIEEDPANPQIILTVRGTGYRLGGAYASE